jgi:HEAT repeat protein
MAHYRISIAQLKDSFPATARKIFRVLLAGFASAIVAAAQQPSSKATPQDAGFFSSLFGAYGVIILLVLAVIALVLMKKMRPKKDAGWEDVEEEPKEVLTPDRPEAPASPRNTMRRAEDRAALRALAQADRWTNSNQPEVHSGFGAYRIDQEVWKLILGKPHRMDVMASRFPEDRRAIEASLIKVLNTSDTDDAGRQRAREALEEYGFLARQSAILLMGRDAWERSSAARMLGVIGSPTSIPFLIEALHDGDVVVRNQAVTSLGSLRLPEAIGALLDIARRHPDIPAPLLSEALSACSVDTLAFLDLPTTEPSSGSDTRKSAGSVTPETFTQFDDLPEGSEDPSMTEALNQLGNEDGRLRAQAAQLLGSHPVQRSVSALAALALNDDDPAARAAAVASLSSIDHESVFAPILISLCDESREVQAAAARGFNSLRFDRGDAYVRVMESTDKEFCAASRRRAFRSESSNRPPTV